MSSHTLIRESHLSASARSTVDLGPETLGALISTSFQKRVDLKQALISNPVLHSDNQIGSPTHHICKASDISSLSFPISEDGRIVLILITEVQ